MNKIRQPNPSVIGPAMDASGEMWANPLTDDQIKADRIKSDINTAPVQVRQFRKVGCADWYDGFADHTDGNGPYEERTLYTRPQPDRVAELEKIIEEVNSWALCACITSPEDMYENFPRIVEITTLKGGA